MPTDPLLSDSAKMFGEYIHKLLTQGGMKVAVTDPESGAVIGTEMVDFTPAMLGKIETYLHHWGVSKSGAPDLARGGNQNLMDRARARAGLKLTLPPLSEKDDYATRTGS